MASKNMCAKTRSVDLPYAIFISGGWEWRVLKRYQSMEKEAENPNAVWFCAVQSPYTFGSWEYGDTYVNDIPGAIAGMDFYSETAGTDDQQISITIAG
jgi:hypothetical protein